MKKTTLFSLVALALAACSEEDGGGTTGGQQELRLTSRLETAARAGVPSERIAENETVWAWVSDAGKNGTDAALYNAEQLTAGSDGELLGNVLLFPASGNAVNIRALHGTFTNPAFEAGITAFPEKVGFSVERNQAESDAYTKSDLLYSAVDGVAPKGYITEQPLYFYHMLSKLELKIVKKPNAVNHVVTGVTIDDVAVDGTLTLREGADLTQQPVREAMIIGGEQTGAVSMPKRLDEGETYEFIIVPQKMGGKTMTFTVVGGIPMSYTFPKNKVFESGKRYLYTITLADWRLTIDESSIFAWDTAEEITDEIDLSSTPVL